MKYSVNTYVEWDDKEDGSRCSTDSWKYCDEDSLENIIQSEIDNCKDGERIESICIEGQEGNMSIQCNVSFSN